MGYLHQILKSLSQQEGLFREFPLAFESKSAVDLVEREGFEKNRGVRPEGYYK